MNSKSRDTQLCFGLFGPSGKCKGNGGGGGGVPFKGAEQHVRVQRPYREGLEQGLGCVEKAPVPGFCCVLSTCVREQVGGRETSSSRQTDTSILGKTAARFSNPPRSTTNPE